METAVHSFLLMLCCELLLSTPSGSLVLLSLPHLWGMTHIFVLIWLLKGIEGTVTQPDNPGYSWMPTPLLRIKMCIRNWEYFVFDRAHVCLIILHSEPHIQSREQKQQLLISIDKMPSYVFFIVFNNVGRPETIIWKSDPSHTSIIQNGKTANLLGK